MKFTGRFLVALLTVLLVLPLSAQSRAKLVVYINIDGLEAQNIATLWNKFDSKGGFRKLLTEGAYFRNLNCNYMASSGVVDCASLMTGSMPSFHGVTASKIYRFIEDTEVSVFYDGTYQGINSFENVSPKRLSAITIADELKLYSNGASRVYSLAIDPEIALVMGGHNPNGAVWLDNESMQFATTTFYNNGLPYWADVENVSGNIDGAMRQSWEPLYSSSSYFVKPKKDGFVSFFVPEKYNFYKYDEGLRIDERVKQFKKTANINTLYREVATRIIRNYSLGKDDFTDFLAIQFTTKTVNDETSGLNSAQKEDIYLRLDKEIKYLIDALDVALGADNYIVMMSGTQTELYSVEQLRANYLNKGKFNSKSSIALLNTFLMARLGQGQWISGYFAKNIYLNRRLIEEKGFLVNEIADLVAEFMTEFQGVHSAYSTRRLLYSNGSSDDLLVKLRNSIYKERAGEVLLVLEPGWVEIDERGIATGVARMMSNTLPFVMYGKGIPAKNYGNKYNIDDIIPTLSNLLYLRPPVSATGKIIELMD